MTPIPSPTAKRKDSSDLKSKQTALAAIEAAIDKKALEPVLLDVTGDASYADYIIVLSGRSDRHVQAVADAVIDAVKKGLGRPAIGVEGLREGQWVLIDFGAVVVHVFYHPVRDFYDLVGMWVDAPRVPVDVPDESRLQVADAYSL
jgi:ribosome-associated protein